MSDKYLVVKVPDVPNEIEAVLNDYFDMGYDYVGPVPKRSLMIFERMQTASEVEELFYSDNAEFRSDNLVPPPVREFINTHKIGMDNDIDPRDLL